MYDGVDLSVLWTAAWRAVERVGDVEDNNDFVQRMRYAARCDEETRRTLVVMTLREIRDADISDTWVERSAQRADLGLPEDN